MHPMYQIFYRTQGVRYADRLFSPAKEKLTAFPRSSIYHFVPGSTDIHDPDVTLPYFQGYNKKIWIDYVLEYATVEGIVQRPSFSIKDALRPFRQKNIQKWSTGIDSWKLDQNPEVLVVTSYGYLDRIYRYTANNMADYYRWRNMFKTVLTNIQRIASQCDRNHFLMIKIPGVIQGRTILDKFIDSPPSVQLATAFGANGPEGFTHLEIWRWLNVEHRKNSLLNLIDPKNYSKVNLVFSGLAGGDQIVNLGYLNSWIKGQPNSTDQTSLMQYSIESVQKLYLKMCMTLNALVVDPEGADVGPEAPAQPGVNVAVKEEPADNQPRAKSVDEVSLTDNGESNDYEEVEKIVDDPEADGGNDAKFSGVAPNLMVKAQGTTLRDIEDTPPEKAVGLSQAMFESLEKDMEALDRVSLVQLKNTGVKLNAIDEDVPEVPPKTYEELVDKVFTVKTPEELLKSKIEEDAEANLITAANYRKFVETTQKYRQSPDPYGSGKSRIKAMEIKPEEVEINKEETDLVAPEGVDDESMSRSSLAVVNAKYINAVLKKDILAMVDSVQATGVAIANHDVEITHSALGSYEHHTLELKPIDGASSSLRFTIPTVDEDGTFLAGGNKYLMRRQRIDVPIRKISPRIVGLTSYYGKTFVQLNTKVVNDDLAWLYRQINVLSLDGSGKVSEMNMGNVFDNDFVAPMIYNALAAEYESFAVKTADKRSFTLNFDKKSRLSLDPMYLKSIEKGGRVYCGHENVRHPTAVVVDKANNFTLIDGDKETALGSISELLGLDTEKRPVNFAEVRIFSKYVPVGIVLAYYLGLEGLITLLKATYRVVEGRKQKMLEKDEFAVMFKDQTLIFKNNNAITTMVLSGFNDFDKTIKLYDRKQFDTKDVYLNLLMAKKMGAIYIRELDILENGFVDPITRKILLDMREPQTFMGLMVRSCELLTTFHHPATQDRAVMRERGYERFAGVIYKELMQSVRQFRNKNYVGRSKIDMSPYQVWNSIMKDNSLKIAEDINPIQNLKESEVITYAGAGGRDKDTMTKASRAYHKSDLGVLSEATVDSSAVGTIAYLTANPNIKDVRGMMTDEKELTPTNILSTTALISPAVVHDD